MKKTWLKKGRGREYLINLHRWRSQMALAASVVTLVAAVVNVIGSLLDFADEGLPVLELYRFYTPNASSLTALAAAFLIPYAVDGVRMKRFTCPKWMAVVHYAVTVAMTLTMFISVAVISQVDPHAAFGGHNLMLHIVCPILVLVSFSLVESGHYFTLRDSLICLIHPLLYAVVYLVEVVLIGEKNGGWPDVYRLTEFVHPAAAMIAFIALSVLVSFVIRRQYNRRMIVRRSRQAALWTDDLDPVAVRIEMYGLGRYAGKNDEISGVRLPADLMLMLTKRYGIRTAELMRAYTQGVLDALAENKEAEMRTETGMKPGRGGRDDAQQ